MDIINFIDDEEPKYRKKKRSSTSKSTTKSKHKHEYTECLFIHNEHPHRGTYCRLCGKVGDLHFFEVEKTDDGMWRQLDYDEVLEMYKHLEQIKVDDIFQRYIPISKSMEEE